MIDRIKVLVVDDSAFMRRVVIKMLESDPAFEVVGYARDGKDALEKIDSLKPQVVTLDVEMPVMDGLSTLAAIMERKPLPVVMLSSHTNRGAEISLRALELGAVDVVLKPERDKFDAVAAELLVKLKVAAGVSADKVNRQARHPLTSPVVDHRLVSMHRKLEIVAIGSSTGGPSALQQVLTRLPEDFPAGVVVVQHMPPGFTGPLAKRLDELSHIHVREAQAGDRIEPGLALIAPAGHQMVLERRGREVKVQLTEKAPVPTLFKPSVDVMMLSVAEVYGPLALGVILTGMGNDGVRGLIAIKEQKGQTIAEAEESCVVFGMPRAAIEAGVIDTVLSLQQIGGEIAAHGRSEK
ncbi:MAG: protein-glutamate methylesterase/protein-glutamine glutaminase [Bacillota bacterium]